MESAERRVLLKQFLPLFPITYARFEETHFDDLSTRTNTGSLPLNVYGHLLMSVTPEGFSPEQIKTLAEIATDPSQGG